MKPEYLRERIAAITGMSAVALGAFGAHGLGEVLERNQRVDTWETAVLYHLVHALMLWTLAGRPERARAWTLFLTGIVIFSGSLYVLSLTNLRWLGAVTPFGGIAFLAGWASLWKQPTSRRLSDAGDA